MQQPRHMTKRKKHTANIWVCRNGVHGKCKGHVPFLLVRPLCHVTNSEFCRVYLVCHVLYWPVHGKQAFCRVPASSAHGKQAFCSVPVFWLTAKWGHTATEPFPVVTGEGSFSKRSIYSFQLSKTM